MEVVVVVLTEALLEAGVGRKLLPSVFRPMMLEKNLTTRHIEKLAAGAMP